MGDDGTSVESRRVDARGWASVNVSTNGGGESFISSVWEEEESEEE